MIRYRLAVFALAIVSGPVVAEDWPRWRGPRGDGTWNAPRLPEKWPVNGPKVVWKQPVGGGYAGITTADGRVYTLDLETAIPPRPKGAVENGIPDGTERVLCFDAKTGKELWKHTYAVKYRDLGGYGNGPRASPTIHDGKVYTLGAVARANLCYAV